MYTVTPIGVSSFYYIEKGEQKVQTAVLIVALHSYYTVREEFGVLRNR
jgi:hypothetical protein